MNGKPDNPSDDDMGWYKGFHLYHSIHKPMYYACVHDKRVEAQNFKLLLERIDMRLSSLKLKGNVK